MDALLLDVAKFSLDNKLHDLVRRLQCASELLSSQDVASLDAFIAALDGKKHSLGVMAALCAKLSLQQQGPPETLLHQMQVFVAEFTQDQVQLVPKKFCQLFHLFTAVVVQWGCPIKGVAVLESAVERYRLSPSHLTSIHSDLVQLCLEAKCLKVALPFLDVDIQEFMADNDQFDVKYLLQYYYYGGIVYTTLRQYDRALFFLSVCLSTPSLAISAVMVEAYKKYVLVSLLKCGKIMPLPQYAPNVVNRLIQPVCTAYTELSEAYESHDVHKLEMVAAKYEQLFARDENFGLVGRVQESLYKRNVQRLTESFLTLSLENVAHHVKLSGGASEAEKYIRDMIDKGEIHATIDQANGMVVFHDNPEKFCTDAMAVEIDQQVVRCIALEEKIAELDREIARDQRYIERTLSGGPEEDPLVEDEALMM